MKRPRYLFTEKVVGNLHQDRSGATVSHLRESAPHHLRHDAAVGECLTGFGHVLEIQVGSKIRSDIGPRAGITSRQHEYRHGLAIGLGHTSKGVFRSRAVLHAEDADTLPRRYSTEGVRHVQADAFLAYDNGANIQFRGRFDQRIHRISEEILDSLRSQSMGDGVSDIHERANLNLIIPCSSLQGSEKTPRRTTAGPEGQKAVDSP